jgi:NAD(P)-dependent dehydrogenase (short-subunit alcohol dehydrogenase family)
MPGRLLEGRVALVTGGASGIGRASALAMAAEGARVCVADLDGDGAERVAKEIEAAGGEALACAGDVSKPEDDDAMVHAAVKRFGALHVAHLNAGTAIPSSILGGDVAAFDRVLAVNLRGVFLGLRAAAPALVEAGGGSVVVTASVAGLRGTAGMPSYYASKHGAIGLVKAAAAEFAPLRIRVNAVCPGVIDTPLLGPAHGQAALLEGVLGRLHPIGRVGHAEEVARVVVFLASEAASFVTGSAWPVDGGCHSILGGRMDERAAADMQSAMAGLGAGHPR